MKVYIAQLVDLDNTHVVGAYTTQDLALAKLDKAMDELIDLNEDLGVYPVITEKYIDDVEEDSYI